jgi:hypothetical protein
MKKLFVFILLIPIFQSCRVYPSLASNTDPYITIDNTYDYYIREYYVDEEKNRYDLKSKQDITGSAKKKLIEVEYLFVSNDGKDNVIYMTTVPDRRQQRYSENYLSSDSVNMHDVRMLLFGKITGSKQDQFLFTDFKPSGRDIWQVQRNSNPAFLKVETISEIKNDELNEIMVADSALASSVIFEKVESFRLVHYDPKKPKAGRAVVEKNRFYYHGGESAEVIIYYNEKIAGGKMVQRFSKKKIVYDPEKIFILTRN